MSDSHDTLIKSIRHYQDSLDKYTENRNDAKLLHGLDRLYKLPIKVIHLEQTGVGRTVNGLRKLGGEVGDSARRLVAKWKEMVVGEHEAQNEDDEEEEDAPQSSPEHSPPTISIEEAEEEEDLKNQSSSHRNRDNHRTDKTNRHHSSHGESSRKKSHKSNGEVPKHRSNKRKIEDTSDSDVLKHQKKTKQDEDSEEELPKTKSRRIVDTESSSDDDNRSKKTKTEYEKKREHEEQRNKSKHDDKHSKKSQKSTSSDRERSAKEESVKRHEHNHKKTKEGHEGGSGKKDKKSGHRSRDDKVKKSKNPTVNGIDSGSGASFAEALGMCEPSSSKTSSTPVKKAKSGGEREHKEKREKSKHVEDNAVPKLLKDVNLEPIELNLSSLLPDIRPNYRPLGSSLLSDTQPKRILTDYERLSNIISSKKERTKVYSGNRIGCSKVPSLFEMCTRILQDNIEALEYTGGVPYHILKPIIEKATPNQLFALEHHNPYLIEDTDELWQLFCQKDFRNKDRQELESWREMYMRCLDEREAKLKALTANIKQAQDKSLPIRTTKLAYVDAVAKPPRNIARKQLKNGTAFDAKRPTVTPSARLTSLATSGEAGKVSVPNPGARAAERASAQLIKPKKAPLMAKSLSLLKNRFRR